MTKGRASAASRVAIVAVVFAFVSVAARCPFAALTHHPCPGCGLTRATISLLRGDLRASFHHHPLGIVVAPILAFVGARETIAFVRDERSTLLATRTQQRVAAMLIVALLCVWIARSLGALGGPEPV